jgi:hypothetical protein
LKKLVTVFELGKNSHTTNTASVLLAVGFTSSCTTYA